MAQLRSVPPGSRQSLYQWPSQSIPPRCHRQRARHPHRLQMVCTSVRCSKTYPIVGPGMSLGAEGSRKTGGIHSEYRLSLPGIDVAQNRCYGRYPLLPAPGDPPLTVSPSRLDTLAATTLQREESDAFFCTVGQERLAHSARACRKRRVLCTS